MNYTTTLVTKNFIVLSFVIVMFGVVLSPAVYAQERHDVSVPDVLDRIATTQAVTNDRDIVCENVSNEDLKLLGDALMQRMIGNEELHTQMDNMMGGEGSETLTAMHEHMARTYLGCSDSGFGMGMMMGGGMMQSMMGGGMMPSMMGGGPMGMMGGGMMGSQEFGSNQRSAFNNSNTIDSMMGFNTMGLGFGGLGSVVMIVFWVFVIAGIVLLIQKLTSRDDTRERDPHSEGRAIDILKERYARGEIDQKEFEQIKRDLV